MTASATLPRPHPATAHHGATRTAAATAARHGGTATQTGFAQLLRSQDDRDMPAADPAAATGAPPGRNDTDARPTERDREPERQPGPEDASAAATATPQPQPEAPKPEAPSTWALVALGRAATPGASTTPTEGDGRAAASDPLAALRDAIGHGLTAQRRHGPAADTEHLADRAAPDGAQADAARFSQALGDAGDAANSTPATPAAAAPAEPLAPAADGALPSLGAITDPARPLHTAAPAETTPTAHASLPATPGTPAFGPALGAQLSTWLQDGIQHASLALHPQDLGPIDVRIAVKDGQTRIDLSADVASTRQALVDAMPQLSAALGDVGLSLSGGGVADPSAQGRQGEGTNAEAGRSAGRSGARSAGASDGNDLATRPAATARHHRSLLDLYA
jgi:flagellar hook-length control protein FliK